MSGNENDYGYVGNNGFRALHPDVAAERAKCLAEGEEDVFGFGSDPDRELLDAIDYGIELGNRGVDFGPGNSPGVKMVFEGDGNGTYRFLLRRQA